MMCFWVRSFTAALLLLLLLVKGGVKAATVIAGQFRITVQLPAANCGDTLLLKYWKVYFNDVYLRSEERLPCVTYTAIVNAKGEAIFAVKAGNRPGYLSLYSNMPVNVSRFDLPTPVIDKYLVENNDDVYLLLTDTAATHGGKVQYGRCLVAFSGKGAAKYRYAWQAAQLARSDFGFRALKPDFSDTVKGLFTYYANQVNRQDTLAACKTRLLARYAAIISRQAYYVLLADIIGECRAGQLCVLLKGNNRDSFHIKARAQVYTQLVAVHDTIPVTLPLQALLVSKNSTPYLVARAIKQTGMASGGLTWQTLYKSYNGELRTRLLTAWLYAFLLNEDDPQAMLETAAAAVTVAPYAAWVQQLKLRLSGGSKAFNFSMPDADGRMISLSDFRGRPVFIDFWFTGCTACKAYYTHVLKEVEEQYGDKVAFITISIDTDKNTWLKSLAGGLYTGTHAININTGKAGQNHEVIGYYQVKGYPRPVLIDKAGKVITVSDKLLRLDGKQTLINQLEAALQD